MEKSEEEACLMAMQLAAGSILPMVLKSAIELDLFELIKKADEAAGISASELAAKLSTTNPDAPNMLHRILRLLTVHSVLTSTGTSPPRYSLSRLGNFFTKNQDGGSVAPISLFVQDKVLMESWYHLKDAIMEGDTAFNRAHGMSVFEYAAVDPKLSEMLNQTMRHLTIHMSKLIEMYKGFEGLNSLVDVGGGIGTTLDMIVSKYPSIRGINFDLPHVVRDAPSYQGIEHVGGDMFMSVPKGEAIFMKFITHDWGDANCLKILRNCREALPEHGKVIIADFVLADIPAKYSTAQTAFNVSSDVMQLTYNPGGKERTEMEFRALATEAGFKEFRKLCTAFTMSIMELHK